MSYDSSSTKFSVTRCIGMVTRCVGMVIRCVGIVIRCVGMGTRCVGNLQNYWSGNIE